MSMHLSIYVGPYLIVPKVTKVKLDKWTDVVHCGRGELTTTDDEWYLVPNCELPGVERKMTFDYCDEECAPLAISPGDHESEIDAMKGVCSELIEWLEKNHMPYVMRWGVVQGLF